MSSHGGPTPKAIVEAEALDRGGGPVAGGALPAALRTATLRGDSRLASEVVRVDVRLAGACAKAVAVRGPSLRNLSLVVGRTCI